MKELLEAWAKLHTGWRLFTVGVALVCGPIWATFDLGSALVVAGIFCLIAALVYAVGAS